MTKGKFDDLTVTAFHEAGHAVIAIMTDINMVSVTIKPGPGRRTLGHVLDLSPYRDPRHPARTDNYSNFGLDCDAETRMFWEANVVVCYAGFLSEEKLVGRGNREGASADFAQALHYLDKLSRSKRELDAYKKLLWIRTEDLVSEFWETIDKLASKLLEVETMTLDEVRVFMEKLSRNKLLS